MATQELQVFSKPDSSGDIFYEAAENAMALGTAAFDTLEVGTMLAPTGADIGFYGTFTVPQKYVGTPVLVIRGVLGEAANTLGFGLQQISRSHSEAFDTAFEAEDTGSNATWTGLVAEDVYEETITITPGAAYQPGDTVPFFFYRDDSVDTQTGEFYLLGLALRYADA